jgi:hypothetical protein
MTVFRTWVVASALCGACVVSVAQHVVEQGRRLFAGEPPIPGRIVGHRDALPAAASRCTNCHSAGVGVGATTTTFGPALDARVLTGKVARRGGPPSAYDVNSLCRLLREGVDPAWVVLKPAMPRYEVSAAQCAALWAFLTRVTP